MGPAAPRPCKSGIFFRNGDSRLHAEVTDQFSGVELVVNGESIYLPWEQSLELAEFIQHEKQKSEEPK